MPPIAFQVGNSRTLSSSVFCLLDIQSRAFINCSRQHTLKRTVHVSERGRQEGRCIETEMAVVGCFVHHHGSEHPIIVLKIPPKKLFRTMHILHPSWLGQGSRIKIQTPSKSSRTGSSTPGSAEAQAGWQRLDPVARSSFGTEV